MTSFLAGFMPEHPAYREAIPFGAFSLAAGLGATAMGFYASTTRQPSMTYMISAFVLGLFASAIFRATEATCKSASRSRKEDFKATQFRKELIGSIGYYLMSNIVSQGMQRSGMGKRSGGGFGRGSFNEDDE